VKVTWIAHVCFGARFPQVDVALKKEVAVEIELICTATGPVFVTRTLCTVAVMPGTFENERAFGFRAIPESAVPKPVRLAVAVPPGPPMVSVALRAPRALGENSAAIRQDAP
jgi:hypothetical protein